MSVSLYPSSLSLLSAVGSCKIVSFWHNAAPGSELVGAEQNKAPLASSVCVECRIAICSWSFSFLPAALSKVTEQGDGLIDTGYSLYVTDDL